jgi:hypothetical protein
MASGVVHSTTVRIPLDVEPLHLRVTLGPAGALVTGIFDPHTRRGAGGVRSTAGRRQVHERSISGPRGAVSLCGHHWPGWPGETADAPAARTYSRAAAAGLRRPGPRPITAGPQRPGANELRSPAATGRCFRRPATARTLAQPPM